MLNSLCLSNLMSLGFNFPRLDSCGRDVLRTLEYQSQVHRQVVACIVLDLFLAGGLAT